MNYVIGTLDLEVRIISTHGDSFMVACRGIPELPPKGETPWTQDNCDTAFQSLLEVLGNAVTGFNPTGVVYPNGEMPVLTGHDFLQFDWHKGLGGWLCHHSGDIR